MRKIKDRGLAAVDADPDWEAALRDNGSVAAFFALAFAFSIPFWLLGAGTGAFLLPGLPIAALEFICPVLAALVLVFRSQGSTGARRFLARALDYSRVRSALWFPAAVAVLPAVSVAAYFVLRETGVALPAPAIAVSQTVGLSAMFLVGAIGEELGWSGYATEPLVARFGRFGGTLLLGAVWALYHVVPLLQAHRSLAWIGWWAFGTLALRFIIVWFYLNAGRSVLVASLVHMTGNVAWQLFPVHGSYFDPRVNGLLCCAAALLLFVVRPPRAQVAPVQATPAR